MDFNTLRALHIVSFVAWFAALFYLVRLFIYHVEALGKSEPERGILHAQFMIMERKLSLIIALPAMILTLVFGLWMLLPNWSDGMMYKKQPWMHMKLGFVVILLGYHHYCGIIRKKLAASKPVPSSKSLRVINEIATVLLVAIVFAPVTENMKVTGIATAIAAFLAVLTYILAGKSKQA